MITSAPTVDMEFVKRMMQKHQRVIYYIEGNSGDVLAYNDDADKKIDAAIAELEDNLLNIEGKFVFVRLHHKAPGSSNNAGGAQKNVLRYRVQLNGSPGQQQHPRNEFHPSNGMFSMFQTMMQQMGDMRVELVKTQMEARISALEKDKKSAEQEGKAPLVDMFLNRVEKKIIAYEQKQELLNKGKKVAEGAEISGNAAAHEPGTERIMQALTKLQNLDSDFVNSIELFADYADKNPLLYQELIKGIKAEKSKE